MDENIDLSGSKILIIDDSAEDIGLMNRIFQKESFIISFATDKEQALRIARLSKPDLILLDVVLPDDDGFHICEALKEDPDTKSIPVVFVSGHSETHQIIKGFELGAVDYLSKPICVEELIARVSTHLRTQYLLKNRDKLVDEQREQAEHMRAILERVSDGIATVTSEGKILSINPAAVKLIGAEKSSELVKKPIFNYLSGEMRHEFIQFFENQRKRPGSEDPMLNQTKEVFVKRKDGDNIPVDLSVSALQHRLGIFVIVMHDASLHKQIEEELRRVSGLDPLTNIANRRRFSDAFAEDWGDAKRNQKSIGLVMIDIDFFKLYNDFYGHPQGDECLKAVASALKKLAHRPKDLVARYGGEEFIVSLPDTDKKGIEKVVQSMCLGVEALNIQHIKSEVSEHVTISVGAAVTIPKREDLPQSLIDAADAALYEAKEGGRNQVVIQVIE